MDCDIKIDPEIRKWIDPLTSDERSQLEANILAEGCRDPLVLWGDVLLDGHNRYDICTENGLEFFSVQVSGVESREDAKRWVLKNQLGRRNLSPAALSDLRGMLYRSRKRSTPGAPEGNSNASKQLRQNVGIESTAESVARETGVTSRTIERDAKFSEALDVLEKHDPDIRQKVKSKSIPLGKGDVVDLAKRPSAMRRRAIDRLNSGKASSLEEALRDDPPAQDGAADAPMGGATNAVDVSQPDRGRVEVSRALDAALAALESVAGAFSELKMVAKQGGDPESVKAARDAASVYRDARAKVDGIAKNIRPRTRRFA